jgi:gamma-glutamylcyclotransferase (GGCT)/AIG2-like uncharacterized protein YtfP
MNVFVYGTLKRGFHNHGFLKGARFVGNAVLSQAFRMYDTGGFPVIIKATDEMPGYLPTGEVYELPNDGGRMLAALDRLEGEGRMYDRVRSTTVDGLPVSVYQGNPDFWERRTFVDGSPRVMVDPANETITYMESA